MSMECVTCGKISDNYKEFLSLLGIPGSNICRECASELGIKNQLSAALQLDTIVVKKYMCLHPEAKSRTDALKKEKRTFWKEIKDAISSLLKAINKRISYKKYSQTKCRCGSCDNVYYYNSDDVALNFLNLTQATVYSFNQLKDLDRCPKCGSKAVIKKEVYYWVDSKGNCVDMQE